VALWPNPQNSNRLRDRRHRSWRKTLGNEQIQAILAPNGMPLGECRFKLAELVDNFGISLEKIQGHFFNSSKSKSTSKEFKSELSGRTIQPANTTDLVPAIAGKQPGVAIRPCVG
jgi:hypothetical protein